MTETGKTAAPGWTWQRVILLPIIVVCFYLIFTMKDAGDVKVNSMIIDGAWWTIWLCMVLFTSAETAGNLLGMYTRRPQPAPAAS